MGYFASYNLGLLLFVDLGLNSNVLDCCRAFSICPFVLTFLLFLLQEHSFSEGNMLSCLLGNFTSRMIKLLDYSYFALASCKMQIFVCKIRGHQCISISIPL